MAPGSRASASSGAFSPRNTAYPLLEPRLGELEERSQRLRAGKELVVRAGFEPTAKAL
jgi:hypothetical protein